jgi:tetratricopeptide (TPR) repeat protein
VVEFAGREHELAELLEWCESEPLRAVRLITGPGGVGKTRLSVELCEHLHQKRWRCVRVGEGAEASALEILRSAWRGPGLLVIDYAETRGGLSDLLRAVATDQGIVRVLLLARAAGEWWERLAADEPAVRDLVTQAGGEQPLAYAVSEDLPNERLIRTAMGAFASALEIAVPPDITIRIPADTVPMLDLHAVALVTVLRSVGQGPVPLSIADVMNELLWHEERFWRGTAQNYGLMAGPGGMTTTMLRQIVAAGALLGARSQTQAVQLLGRVPGAAATLKVATWLRDLYPPDSVGASGADDEWLGTLSPDRLAERFVVSQLTRSPELAQRCLRDLDEYQAFRAITLLGRAATNQPAAGLLLRRVIADLPADLVLPTAISPPSAPLDEAALAATRSILELLPGADRELRARGLSWLGVVLAQKGRHADAVQVTQEVVDAYRELASARPTRYHGDLARSLSNLGVTLSELGRSADALPAEQEAAQIRRDLAATDPARYRGDLARSLSNLGVTLSELGRSADALPAEQEAVQIRRDLAATDPARYSAHLARLLTDLSVTFSQRRPADVLPPAQEAVAIWRELTTAYPDRYRADQAAALSNLSILFSEVGRPAEALDPAQEAVAIWRELTTTDPDRYRADLAASLSNLGVRFSELGRPAEALPTEQEAVAIWRELTTTDPDRYRADLAASLSNLGVRFSELGRAAEGLAPAQEAVAAYREMAATDPDRYRADLATSLSNLSVRFSELGRPAEALDPAQEAVAIRRELTATDPDRYGADLARSLSNLGIWLSELGRAAEGLAPAQEAVAAYREMAATDPDRYRADLATSLRRLAAVLDSLGRMAEAEDVRRQSAQMRAL